MPERIREGGSYNPHSASYRILHINHPNAYPNALDRSQGCTGCAIGIHGKCSSVGCIGMRNEQMDSIEKALETELKHLPIPVLIFYSSKASRVKSLIKLYRERGDESAPRFLERMEKVREFWEKYHRVPKYGWDEHGYVLKR